MLSTIDRLILTAVALAIGYELTRPKPLADQLPTRPPGAMPAPALDDPARLPDFPTLGIFQ